MSVLHICHQIYYQTEPAGRGSKQLDRWERDRTVSSLSCPYENGSVDHEFNGSQVDGIMQRASRDRTVLSWSSLSSAS